MIIIFHYRNSPQAAVKRTIPSALLMPMAVANASRISLEKGFSCVLNIGKLCFYQQRVQQVQALKEIALPAYNQIAL